MIFVVLLIIVAGIVFYRFATKDKREEKEKIDREKVRSSAKTWALAEAVCKEFLSDGHCFKRLCDPNVSSFTIEVSRWGIIAKTGYFRAVEGSIVGKEALLRFSDIALEDLESDAMASELENILLHEIGKMERISVSDNGNISIIKRTW